MQTLRKRNSPSKYKNEPARFLGDGMTFKAKLIGILEVNEARGDKMCQDALNDLKTAIRAAGEHKQRITISIAIDGLRLRDEKTGDSMYHHPVHKISFIAQDMSDSRAFGYIFGSPDTGHRFFGIKTDKTASQVVIAMRDLFQVVFELKKKEIEMTKRNIELHQNQFSGHSNSDHSTKVDGESKNNVNEHSKSTSMTSRDTASAQVTKTSRNSEAIADLLDLEDELNSIQQGISQMDRITPSDPFGPISLKGESFLDSFREKTTDGHKSLTTSRRTVSQSSTKDSDGDKSASLFSSGASTSSRAMFFPQYSPNPNKMSSGDPHWFDQETDTLFKDATSHEPEAPTSPVTFHTPTGDSDPINVAAEEKRSPLKGDFFTDLDPLGTGKVKPYLDKKDFFQELKNPPKKVLKELLTEPSKPETTYYFPTDFKQSKNETSPKSSNPLECSVIKSSKGNVSGSLIESLPKDSGKYSKIDPFEDMDPFEKTDPFLEDSFPKSIGFPSLVSAKASVDIIHDRVSQRSQVSKTPEDKFFDSPSKYNVFSSSIHGPLRVSLPPEKPDTNSTISLSSLASRLRSSPSPTEDTKVRRKHYQALRYSQEDKSDDQSNSPILEEVYMKGSPKPFYMASLDKKISVGSPPPVRSEKVKSKMSASLELLDSTPDPPPRPKTTLFAIKPPPLPAKKQNQPIFRPPARPPSLEEHVHYDFLRQKNESSFKDETTKANEKSPKKSPKNCEASKKKVVNNFNFPVLPRPPQRKSSADSHRTQSLSTPTSGTEPSPEPKESSVLNITLNQLDQSGLASLASTLGIPTENVCNMTLQELTKMLAQKYLGSDIKSAGSGSNEESNFQADFDSNFRDVTASENNYDKYAVFKELIVGEKINSEISEKDDFEDNEEVFQTNISSSIEECKMPDDDGVDRYAALRQLSLSAQKSDNLSEELDVSNEEDSSAKADNISDIVKQPTDESVTPLHTSEIVGESPIARLEPLDDIEEVVIEELKPLEAEDWNETHVDNEKIEIETEVLEEENFENINDNWATFEKEQIITTTTFHEEVKNKENSPLSSDGKEEGKSPGSWKRSKGKGSAPWKDEDESCDDFSAKDSYWSDESSHDGQSPVKETIPVYHRKVWNKHTKPVRTDSSHSWQRKWVDDTEDEYDDTRRRRRIPHTSYDWERKKEDYEGRGGAWGWESRETDRYGQGYNERRKQHTDYRRRCDSDASDKEYINTDRNYTDTSGKKMQYYSHGRDPVERHWSDNRESRSKYKRPTGHKRPSSASDAKRYETMYSPMEHPPRSPDKRESDEDEYSQRFRPSRKDLRYHSNIEHYGSYDRRAQATHRRMQRGRRLKDGENAGSFLAETRHFFPPETPISTHSEDTPEAVKELHFKFEDDFTPSPTDQFSGPSRKKFSEKGDKRTHELDWSNKFSKKDSVPLADNNNENFGHFVDGYEQSPKLPKDKSKAEGVGVIKKPSLKGRSHLAMLSRQDSNASLRKSESINIFSRENDPFEDDDFFSSGNNGGDGKLSKFFSEKSKSNTNVSDPFAWKDMFSDQKFED